MKYRVCIGQGKSIIINATSVFNAWEKVKKNFNFSEFVIEAINDEAE